LHYIAEIADLNSRPLLQYPAEAHIVTLVAKGDATEWGCDEFWNGGDPVLENCTAVFGIMYKLGDSTPDYITKFWDFLPEKVEANATVSGMTDFDLNKMLPTDKSYYTYYGSLVSPHGSSRALSLLCHLSCLNVLIN
jgi:hypothetical protein